MPAPKPDRTNVSLTMNAALGAKLDRLVERTGSTRNAVILGVLAGSHEDDLFAAYERAVSTGAVRPRVNLTEAQRQLLGALKGIDENQAQELLASLKKKDPL